MKNLKMTTAAIITAGILALITACNMNADSHEHTFKTEWASDETNHWHAASCEHKDEVKDKAAHTWDDGVVTTAATKDSTGIKTFTCTVCNKTKTEEIAKLNSDSDESDTGNTDKDKENENKGTHKHTYAATWTTDANHHWHSATCGHTAEISNKAEHNFGEWKVTVEATEEAEGKKERECSVCGYKTTETVAKLEHTHKFAAAYSSDADNHWFAATCDHKDQVKDKAAHTFGEWKITTQPTEEAEGAKERVCPACRYKVTDTVAKLDHVHAKGTHHDAVGGTCVKKGTVEYYDCVKATCEVKLDKEGKPLATIEGELNSSNHTGTATTWTITATKHKETYDCCKAVKTAEADHSFGEWTVKTPATCGAEGTNERECSTCNYKETASIAKLPHAFASAWTPNATHHWHAATCGHTTEVSGKAEHTFGDWTEKTAATCSAEGSKERECSTCKYKETTAIAKLPHTFATDWSKDATNHWHAATCEHTTEVSGKAEHNFGDWIVKTPATCSAEGTNERECSTCKYKETSPITKLPHTINDWTLKKVATTAVKGSKEGKCTACAATITEEIPLAPEGFVGLTTFYIAKTELTYAEWYDVYQWAVTHGYVFQDLGREGNAGTDGAAPTSGSKQPVSYVSWRDAVVWCNAASEKAGLTPVYEYDGKVLKEAENYNNWGTNKDNTTRVDPEYGKAEKATVKSNANGYRLPTEAEWIFAAKGGQDYTYSGSNKIDEVAWYYYSTSDSKTHDVGTKKENDYGLYDMSGNVAEWCQDKNHYATASAANYRLLLGGSYKQGNTQCRVSDYSSEKPCMQKDNIGFRVCRTAN